jgi:hypothetical protein
MKLILLFLVNALLLCAQSIDTEFYIYKAQGVDNNLREMPSDILDFDLPYENTYLHAIGMFVPNYSEVMNDLDIGSTMVLVKHNGLQSHVEANIALSIRHKNLIPSSVISFDYTLGGGLSYAFATPVYEDTASNGLYYRLQCFLHFDVELYTPLYKSISILARVHHRSGIYGLIAPPHVGSNFVGLGLVYRLLK